MVQLNEREAFIAMTLFLKQFYEQTGGDFLTLLTDIQIEPDGVTLDPAAWQDWLGFVAEVKTHDIPYDPALWDDFVARNEAARRDREG
jgi:hypothetical protein